MRLKVVEATLNIRAPNDVALHVLTMALRDEVPAVRAAAGYAVSGMMLSDGRPDTARVGAFLVAVPGLLVALSDAEPSVRAAAAFALGQVRSRAPATVPPALRRAAGDPVPIVRAAAEAASATLEGRSLPEPAGRVLRSRRALAGYTERVTPSSCATPRPVHRTFSKALARPASSSVSNHGPSTRGLFRDPSWCIQKSGSGGTAPSHRASGPYRRYTSHTSSEMPSTFRNAAIV